MAQLFDDQCREAWSEARWRGLAMLWLHVAPDLLKTSILEHLAKMRKGKSNSKTMTASSHRRLTAPGVFMVTFAGVFLLIFCSVTFVEWVLPETYASKGMLLLRMNEAGSEGASNPFRGVVAEGDPGLGAVAIGSQGVLDKVIDSVDLNQVLAGKFNGGARLRSAGNTGNIIIRKLQSQSRRMSNVIEIIVKDGNKEVPPKIVNGIMEAYLCEAAQHFATNVRVSFIQRATPSWRLHASNIVRRIAISLEAALLLAFLTGGFMGLIAYVRGQDLPGTQVIE